MARGHQRPLLHLVETTNAERDEPAIGTIVRTACDLGAFVGSEQNRAALMRLEALVELRADALEDELRWAQAEPRHRQLTLVSELRAALHARDYTAFSLAQRLALELTKTEPAL
jgi:hypothetical protein